MNAFSYRLSLLLLWLITPWAYADLPPSTQPKVQQFINEMSKEKGFNRQELTTLFKQVNIKKNIIDSMNKPYEKKTWDVYKKLFLTPQRVSEGISFWQKNQDTLIKAQNQFGVPASIIVAILGVETYYGRIQGKYRVIDALSTLAFNYPKREKFFTKELKQFLLLCKEQNISPLDMLGSYAGAMGQPQFMPSSYRAYAIDYTGNGKSDLLTNNQDVIGSVANYFKRHGWHTNQPITAPAEIHGKLYEKVNVNAKKAAYSLKTLEQLGITPKHLVINEPNEAGLVELSVANSNNEFWLAYPNFYVITRYNTSKQYAMAVYLLSQELKQQWAALHRDERAYA